MEDNKVSVKEALDKLYDLSWMVGSTAMEYLTDKDGEKIIWRMNCLNLRKPLVIHLNHAILMRRLLKLLLDQSSKYRLSQGLYSVPTCRR